MKLNTFRISYLCLILLLQYGLADACKFSSDCPDQCDGNNVLPRDCNLVTNTCETIPSFKKNCSDTSLYKPFEFDVSGKILSVPQKCLLSDTSAYCGNDKVIAMKEWTEECRKVREKYDSYEQDRIILSGIHNYMNIMAACLAVYKTGVSYEVMRNVLQQFKGVEHRLELVRVVNGVRYINDSKATTVESLFYALQSYKDPIVLIAGGKDKGSDFTRLNDLIITNVKHLVLIGVAADKMEKAWHNLKPLSKAGSLQEAVLTAQKTADENDVVLLSPACASFDMFSDYEDRGRQFKNIVNALEK